MNHRLRIFAAVAATVFLFLGVQLGALVLVEPFQETRGPAVEDPQDPTNSLVFFGVIIGATAVMLAAFKYDAQRFLRALIVGVSVMLSWFVFVELLPTVTVGGLHAPALVGALVVGAGLLVYPEWYVIDAAGVLMGAGAAGLFGISFGLFPAILFLSVLAIYDAISVYKTEHMLSLADGALDLKIPVVFVVPMTLSYSYLAEAATPDVGASSVETTHSSPESSTDKRESTTAEGSGVTDGSARATDASSTRSESVESSSEPGASANADQPAAEPTAGDAIERDALFIGLGDAVIPTILVASAVTFLDVPAIDVPLIALNLPALGAIVGTIAGLLVLLAMVLRGRPHAGLPLLNGGAIGGYLVGAFASGVSLATAVGL